MLEFNEEKHEYTLDGKKLISVTQLMQKHGLAPSYAGVSTEVLNAKAERGTLIHEEIEAFNKSGAIGFTPEMAQFKDYIQSNKIRVKESELRIHNDIVAGTCDLVLNCGDGRYTIADIKTTSVLHKEAVSWQLSIYAYLLANTKEQYFNFKGQAFHFNKESELNVVDIPLKPFEEIERLMECERNGEIFNKNIQAANLGDLQELWNVEKYIADLEKQKKEAEINRDQMREQLLNAMEKNGILNYESDFIKVSYVAPSTRKTIDSARLKKEHPDIAEEYSKTSETKASVRITLKEV